MFRSVSLSTSSATARALGVFVRRVSLPAPTQKLNILITGSNGQIGTELARSLRERHGRDAVVCTDVRQPTEEFRAAGPFEYADVLNYDRLAELVTRHKINCVVHLAAVLSAAGEKNPDLALKVNIGGTHVILNLARQFNLRVLSPSTIAAFGPTTPRDLTPDFTIQRPTSMYGVTKVYMELLGEYYNQKFGVDFRSLRYPGIISSETLPTGGTTDYAVDIYLNAVRTQKYTCYLRAGTTLPMMYIPDCLKATVALIEADAAKLTQRTYNVAAMSFEPEEIAASIRKQMPQFKLDYQVDEAMRQRIAESWPRSLDDSAARRDWAWKPDYDLDGMTKDMLKKMAATAHSAHA
jgi:threonine 3-dehydrogenase